MLVQILSNVTRVLCSCFISVLSTKQKIWISVVIKESSKTNLKVIRKSLIAKQPTIWLKIAVIGGVILIQKYNDLLHFINSWSVTLIFLRLNSCIFLFSVYIVSITTLMLQYDSRNRIYYFYFSNVFTSDTLFINQTSVNVLQISKINFIT